MHIAHTKRKSNTMKKKSEWAGKHFANAFQLFFVVVWPTHETQFIQVKNSKYMEKDEHKKESKNNVTD